MSTTLSVLLAVYIALGVGFTAADAGQTAGEILDTAKANHSYMCSDSDFNDLYDAVQGSPIANLPVTRQAISDAKAKGASVLFYTAEEAATNTADSIRQWINDNLIFDAPLSSAMDFCNGDGDTMRVSWEHDDDFENYDRWYLTVTVTHADGTQDVINTFNGLKYESNSYSKSHEVFPQTSFIDSEGNLHVCRADGSLLTVIDPDDFISSAIPSSPAVDIIGQVGEYDVAPDGSITLPDGEVVFPNVDGTYTIGGDVYSPTYNISNVNPGDLINLVNIYNNTVNKFEWARPGENDEDIAAPAVSYSGTLSEFIYSSPRWASVFPFCIPWDFVYGVKLLSASPKAPVFRIPFEIPAFGVFPGYSSEIVLNFAKYDTYFYPVRWFTTIFFVMSLCFVTFKIVKGAN